MTKEEIGATLKELRKQCGKTQKQVAGLLGRTQQIIGHWETGYSQPDANTLFELCNLYGVSVDEAFGFTGETHKNDKAISEIEQNHIKKYRSLNENGKNKVDEYMNFVLSQAENVKFMPDFKAIKKYAEEFAEELAPLAQNHQKYNK